MKISEGARLPREPAFGRTVASWLGSVLNVSLRLGIVGMVVEVLRSAPDDPRFLGKGLGVRAVAVILPASALVPALWLWRRGTYPVWMDNLYLSIFVVDLGGNVLDLYNGFRHFDLIPHAHGGGAVTVLAAWLFRIPMLSAVGAATVGHVLLEAQESFSDVFLGTRNVRGPWDTIGDLLAGVVGSVMYGLLYLRFIRGARRESRSPLPGRWQGTR
jgi:hypothetical protein